MYPYDVVRSKMRKEKFMEISKKQYLDLVDRLSVADKTTLEGDWIVGDGCKAHSCAWDNAIIDINIKTRKVFAMMWSDKKNS